MAKKSNKYVYIVALSLFFAGFVYLVYSSLGEDNVYFLNVSEALAMDHAELKQARLFGKVSAQDLNLSPDHLSTSFTLLDKLEPGKSLRVTYSGTVPDTFKAGVEVITEGAFDWEANTFVAKSLVTKCPSKYEEKSRQMDAPKY